MKLMLSTLLALALTGALLSGCNRPADEGKRAATPSGKMGEAATGGTSGEKQQDPRTTPKQK
jgi:hypothetical protein